MTKNTITVLAIGQHSAAQSFMQLSYDWTNYRANYRPFDEIAAAYPALVREIAPNDAPDWGSAFYAKGPQGTPVLQRENWDTSG